MDKQTTLCGRPITLPEERIAEARRRFGQRPFAHEAGSTFRWISGPFFLTQWLHNRKKSA